MAYVNDYMDDEEDPSQAPSIAGGGQVVGGGSAPVAQGSGRVAGQPTRSDRYQNLNEYLDANKGSGFGQTFTNKIQGEVDKADAAQNQAYDNFKQSVDANTIAPNQGLVQEALSNPVAVANDANKLADFKKQRDAKYTGVKGLSDLPASYQGATSAQKRAGDVVGASQSEGGRFALLSNFFGSPTPERQGSDYSYGQKSLDNLLLQNDPQTQSGIKQAKANYNVSNANLGNVQTNAANYAGNAAAQTEQSRKMLRDLFGIDGEGKANQNGLYGNTIKGVETGLDNAMAANNNAARPALNSLREGNVSAISPEDKAKYGIDTSGVERILDVDPSTFLRANPGYGRLSNLSQDDYAKVEALSKLLDQSNPYEGQGYGDVGPSYIFDKPGFQTAVQNREQERVNELYYNIPKEQFGGLMDRYNNADPSQYQKPAGQPSIYDLRDFATAAYQRSGDSSYRDYIKQINDRISALDAKYQKDRRLS